MATLDDFYKGGPKTTAEAFPPHCYKTHWDPTVLSSHVLPQHTYHTMAMDPRPHSRICTVYYNSAQESLPDTKTSFDLPPGGAAGLGAPFSQFNPDAESALTLRNYPLSKCAERRYAPSYKLPGNGTVTGVPEKEMAMPYKSGEFAEDCRRADDDQAWLRSSRVFFNHTRYDRLVPNPKPSAQSK